MLKFCVSDGSVLFFLQVDAVDGWKTGVRCRGPDLTFVKFIPSTGEVNLVP